MLPTTDLGSLPGRTLHSTDGTKIGKIVDVYESTDGDGDTFITVATGLFGSHVSFVPTTRAELRGDDVVVPYDKELVKDAPRVDNDEELTSEEEERLYRHYDLVQPGAGAAAATPATTATTAATTGPGSGRHAGETAVPRGTSRQDVDGDGVFDDVQATAVGRDTSGLTTDDAMTRSEERLHVGVAKQEAGRARLRKRIVTEMETRTVPVQHQEVRVTREPITEGNLASAVDGPTLTEAVHEVVVTEEVPVVSKETVAVERVRLDTATVTEQVTVTEDVRKEQIELETEIDNTTDARPRTGL